MAKSELGTKRLCPNCGTKYYDLNRDPILCPKCGTAFATSSPSLRTPKAAPVEEEEETEREEAQVDFVSLEEADAEQGATEEVEGMEDEDEIADIGGGDDDDTFLEPEDEDEDIDGIDIDVGSEDEER